jgi:hypothetical protein
MYPSFATAHEVFARSCKSNSRIRLSASEAIASLRGKSLHYKAENAHARFDMFCGMHPNMLRIDEEAIAARRGSSKYISLEYAHAVFARP